MGWFSAFFCTSTSPQEHSNLVFSGIVARSLTVGYAQSALDTDYGAVMVTPQFINVGGEKVISLDSIKPTAAEGVDLAYGVNIQILDNAGYTTEDEYSWNGSAWETTSGAIATGVTFPAGQGLWVTSSLGEDVVGFQSAGAVNKSDVSVALDTDYGAVAIGNPFPTALALNDILPTAAEGVDLAYGVNIQILDNAGYTTEDEYSWNGTAWETTSGSVATDVTFPAGQGLWVTSSLGEDVVHLQLPAPEL